MKKQKVFLLGLASVVMILFCLGCDGGNPSDEEGQGEIFFGMSLSKALDAGFNITEVRVAVSKVSYSDSMSLIITGDSATGTFIGLPKGTYSIEVRIYDGVTLIGYGTGSGEVMPLQTAIAHVNVELFPGNLSVIVNWSFVTSFTDPRDDRVYKLVRIGSQVWMAENLDYRASENSSYYNNDSATYYMYGRLYTWEEAMTAAPPGWHLPTDEEWTTLTTYLGGEAVAGGKLKEAGTAHWVSPNTGATNETGFKALPGGYHYPNDTYGYLGYVGLYWSATPYGGDNAIVRAMYEYDAEAHWANGLQKTNGISVRCVRD
jgi:uncharacterized protein (TIGR02145 family)